MLFGVDDRLPKIYYYLNDKKIDINISEIVSKIVFNDIAFKAKFNLML